MLIKKQVWSCNKEEGIWSCNKEEESSKEEGFEEREMSCGKQYSDIVKHDKACEEGVLWIWSNENDYYESDEHAGGSGQL